jgi:arylsulfatase A-like enzyme
MPYSTDFRTSLISTWFRMATLGVVALVFSAALVLAPGRAEGWSYYLTAAEVCFEVLVRLLAAALAGLALGTLCTAILAPILWFLPAWRDRIVDSSVKVAVVLVLFVVSRYALEALIEWSYDISGHRAIYDKLLLGAQLFGFALALCLPRSRHAMVNSLDGFLGPKVSRRTVVTTLVATAGIVATEFALSKTVLRALAASPLTQRPKQNFLLITFDALCAEDMSLYGRPLPTTPNIDGFARQATVFKNFYSACTFTTPSIASMMTGRYPSDTLVYQLQGRINRPDADASLPALLRTAGYRTGGFVTNPFAYYFSDGMAGAFDVRPEPVFQQGGVRALWGLTGPLHQNSGIGSRVVEYMDLMKVWSYLGGMPNDLCLRYRPEATFEQARRLLADMPDGFFLWVHLITPHNPYLPDREDQGRFLDLELTAQEEKATLGWKPHYPPDQQKFADRRRLRYDEFIATADRAFGSFMSDLEQSGRLQNTTVIVSADHGESFEGGVYEHRSVDLTRPVIHIPLMIRTPNQQTGASVELTADQTSLAPTILELAGVPRPDAMKGPSLVPWLNRNSEGKEEGVAYCQYFETNSVYKPLRRGSVGVIDGQYQYVVYLDTQKGVLRPLAEAQDWQLDRSAEHPEKAEDLRASIRTRFPGLLSMT